MIYRPSGTVPKAQGKPDDRREHVLDVIDRQPMLFNVFDIAACFFIPDDSLPHPVLSRVSRYDNTVL
jgi:hypothetical protein